jgi:predicted nucleic acid-binding protein
MIAVDTGPLVAIYDSSDDEHEKCLSELAGLREKLVTTTAVLTEASHLLSFEPLLPIRLLEHVLQGRVAVHGSGVSEIERAVEVMKKYRDLPADFADATIVAMCETLGIRTVFTLDRKDFGAFRPRHVRTFNIIPRT